MVGARRLWAFSVAALGAWSIVCGCGESDESAGGEYIEEDFPPWTCDTEATTTGCAESGDVPVAECRGASDCAAGVCAADFNGDIGRFECQASCISPFDDARWCVDASACCDAAAICDRGYCLVDDGTTGDVGESSGAASTDSETGASSSGG